MMALLLLAAARGTAAAAAGGCTFYSAASPTSGGCLAWDLSGLPTVGFLVNDTSSYHEPYLIGSPCGASSHGHGKVILMTPPLILYG